MTSRAEGEAEAGTSEALVEKTDDKQDAPHEDAAPEVVRAEPPCEKMTETAVGAGSGIADGSAETRSSDNAAADPDGTSQRPPEATAEEQPGAQVAAEHAVDSTLEGAAAEEVRAADPEVPEASRRERPEEPSKESCEEDCAESQSFKATDGLASSATPGRHDESHDNSKVLSGSQSGILSAPAMSSTGAAVDPADVAAADATAVRPDVEVTKAGPVSTVVMEDGWPEAADSTRAELPKAEPVSSMVAEDGWPEAADSTRAELPKAEQPVSTTVTEDGWPEAADSTGAEVPKAEPATMVSQEACPEAVDATQAANTDLATSMPSAMPTVSTDDWPEAVDASVPQGEVVQSAQASPEQALHVKRAEDSSRASATSATEDDTTQAASPGPSRQDGMPKSADLRPSVLQADAPETQTAGEDWPSAVNTFAPIDPCEGRPHDADASRTTSAAAALSDEPSKALQEDWPCATDVSVNKSIQAVSDSGATSTFASKQSDGHSPDRPLSEAVGGSSSSSAMPRPSADDQALGAAASASPRSCTRCGVKLEVHTKFCTSCGAPLIPQEPPAPPPAEHSGEAVPRSVLDSEDFPTAAAVHESGSGSSHSPSPSAAEGVRRESSSSSGLKGLIAQLSQQLAEEVRRREVEESELEVRAAERKRLREELEALQRRKSAVLANAESAKEAAADSRKQRDELQAAHEELQMEVERQQEELKKLREEASTRKGAGRDWAREGPETDALVETKLQIAEAHDRLAQAKLQLWMNKEGLRKQLADLQAENDKLRALAVGGQQPTR
eukprot:TRINITY_DN9754_c0_g1_i1.p1 TRINITY_DN9754_c0_g1~~TRINITY_DN9754_c0_g1_i1.p1  ORF type:complete len:816 (+),score=199.81 TRINITY_DN9754_c0_g1_i1:87-2450(+)